MPGKDAWQVLRPHDAFKSARGCLIDDPAKFLLLDDPHKGLAAAAALGDLAGLHHAPSNHQPRLKGLLQGDYCLSRVLKRRVFFERQRLTFWGIADSS
jgi:hypothetical protein